MRRQFALIANIALLTAILMSPAFAKAETVTGKVVDLACLFLNKDNTTKAHKGKGYSCAQACAREGFAVGILTTSGKIYEVTGDLAANKNAKLVPHMSHTVTVTGDVSEKDGQIMISASELKMSGN
jgi:hypothetical protein